MLLPYVLFSQDISVTFVDSVISVNKKIGYSEFNSLLRKINQLPSDTAIARYKYIGSVIRNNDSLWLYTNSYHISTLMRAEKNNAALDINLKGLKLADSLGWPNFQYDYHQMRANIFENLSIVDSTLIYINKSENIINNNKEILGHKMARVYQQRSFLEQEIGNFEKENYYQEKIAEVVETYPEKDLTYYLFSVVYHFKSKRDYKKHAYYLEKLKEYSLKTKGLRVPKMHQSINSMLKMDNYDEEIKELKKVLSSIKDKEYKKFYIKTLNAIGSILIEKGSYSDGVNYLLEAINNNEDKVSYTQLVSYENIYVAYYQSKNYKKAIDALNKIIELNNKIRSKEVLNKIADIKVKYETEKKEAELKLLQIEAEKNKKQNQLYLVVALSGILIAGLLGVFGYKNLKKNKKLDKQKILLEIALSEKNTLLKEVHHRVKNSFQIVSSLLYLQSENIEDKEAKLAIKEAENRVKSMVLVHQKLYNKDELVGINTKEYITDLVTDIFQSHNLKKETISYTLNIEPVVLNIETITPLGLILNELIINVLKHAFTVGVENNSISVDFTKLDDKLVLKVVDNGKGFEGDIKQTSFGITLMKALSKQLKATLNYKSKRNEGTEAVLNISKFTILS